VRGTEHSQRCIGPRRAGATHGSAHRARSVRRQRSDRRLGRTAPSRGARAPRMSDSLVRDLEELLARFRAELEYNDAKGGGGGYREGMHDGLHFAADALTDLLTAHGVLITSPSARVRIPREYGVE